MGRGSRIEEDPGQRGIEDGVESRMEGDPVRGGSRTGGIHEM